MASACGWRCRSLLQRRSSRRSGRRSSPPRPWRGVVEHRLRAEARDPRSRGTRDHVLRCSCRCATPASHTAQPGRHRHRVHRRALATATHGSGARYMRSLSGVVRGMRLVTGDGRPDRHRRGRPGPLHAAQVSVGTLGVATLLGLLHVTDATGCASTGAPAVGRRLWSTGRARRRAPPLRVLLAAQPASAALANPHEPRRAHPTIQRHVKVYDEVAADDADDATQGRCVHRCHRNFPMVHDRNLHGSTPSLPLDLMRTLRCRRCADVEPAGSAYPLGWRWSPPTRRPSRRSTALPTT